MALRWEWVWRYRQPERQAKEYKRQNDAQDLHLSVLLLVYYRLNDREITQLEFDTRRRCKSPEGVAGASRSQLGGSSGCDHRRRGCEHQRGICTRCDCRAALSRTDPG